MQQLIPVDVPDETAGVVVGGDVGGVLRKDVPYNLVNGVVALLAQRFVHRGEDFFDLLFPVLRDGKGNGGKPLSAPRFNRIYGWGR